MYESYGMAAGLATEFGKAADEGLKSAASQQAAAPLRAIIQGTTQAASGLQAVVAPMAKGFLGVAGAVAQAFGPQVAGVIAQVAGAQRRKAPLTTLACASLDEHFRPCDPSERSQAM
ncbi:hypothetical protein [Streptomyces azureus]|uniref:hypothetical protein n=1 Tax=Streptomyces azureus TaxID=146537 RepID=UPI00157ACD96|nr:hypothetical protein [Streptomyces azureus]